METYYNEIRTLSQFLDYCNEPVKIGKYVNGELVITGERPRTLSQFTDRYKISRVVLDSTALFLVFSLIDKDGKEVRKSFDLYDIGWCYDTYGMMCMEHYPEGKKKIEYIIS